MLAFANAKQTVKLHDICHYCLSNISRRSFYFDWGVASRIFFVFLKHKKNNQNQDARKFINKSLFILPNHFLIFLRKPLVTKRQLSVKQQYKENAFSIFIGDVCRPSKSASQYSSILLKPTSSISLL